MKHDGSNNQTSKIKEECQKFDNEFLTLKREAESLLLNYRKAMESLKILLLKQSLWQKE